MACMADSIVHQVPLMYDRSTHRDKLSGDLELRIKTPLLLIIRDRGQYQTHFAHCFRLLLVRRASALDFTCFDIYSKKDV